MGLDWITRCAPTWERSWERGLEKLAQPELFQPEIPEAQRTFRARPVEGHQFVVGEHYHLRVNREVIEVYQGVGRVAVALNPPPEIVRVMRESGFGHAIGCVQKVYPRTGAADLAAH